MDKILTGAGIVEGDLIVGLASSGIHSNGISLARKVLFEKLGMKPDDYVDELGCAIGAELLKPTKIYVKSVLNILRDFEVHGIAHITGGGFIDNIPRIFPKGLGTEIKKGTWSVHKVFTYMQEKGDVTEEEMYRTFNMGIGMIFIVDKKFKCSDIKKIEDLGTKVYEIGKVIEQEGIKLIN